MRERRSARGKFSAALAAALLAAAACGERGAPGRSSGKEGAAAPEAAVRAGAAAVPRGPRLARRVLLVAVDGATWRIADPLLEGGRLPNLARLVGRGARASLTTLEPTVSPAIWTTIATGMLPRRHGILGFEGVPGQTMRTLPNATMRRVKAYWEMLRDAGLTSGTVGWWATWPADELGPRSFLVSDRIPYTRMEAAVGRAALTERDVWPPDLLEEVAPLVERPDEIAPEAARRFLGFDRETMERLLLGAAYRMGSYLPEFKFVYQSDRSTFRIARRLLEQRPVDVAAVYFAGIDTVSHLYWHFSWPEEFPRLRIPPEDAERFGGVIPEYYVLIDEYLGRLLEVAGPGTTVIVVSDHGFGPTGRVPWSGGHGRITPGAPIAPPGLLVMSGPGIARGVRLERAHVLDVVPTLLHLLGLPAGEDMLGRVLVEALAPGSPPPLPRIESWERVGRPRAPGPPEADAAGDAERMARLRALGYIQ